MTDEKRPIAVDDLYRLNAVEDLRISPDGRWVAYVRVTVDKMENGYKRNIWLSALDGGEPRQLTRSGKDMQPRWSPDGKTLAFVSTRDERPQIYLLPVAEPGGEARALTSALTGAVMPDWSPDGQHIAYLSPSTAEERAKEDAGETPEPPADKLAAKHQKERLEADEKKRLDPLYVWRVPYREGTSYLDGRYAQVYVVPVAEGLPTDEARPRRLTDMDANYQPPRWSPDAKLIYSGRQRDIGEDEPFRDNVLVSLRVDDGEEHILTDDSHTCYAPMPSPDGQTIAFARIPRGAGGSLTESVTRLAVMPADGGAVRDLNLELDRSVSSVDWSPDSQALIFSAGDNGIAPVYRVMASGGAVETRLTGPFLAGSVSVGPDGGIAYVGNRADDPCELYYLPPGESQPRQLTAFNRDFLDEVIVQPAHEMRFQSPSGVEIQGWYILPVGYEEGQQYPLALNIHGGPHVMWSSHEATMFHEWQFHAARGYVVFFCNPRGGEGYGEAFLKALHKAWGDVAFEDIMAGVDTLLQKGFVDEQRLAVTGGSYGGYMTAWVVGHTNRFAAAVSQRGVYNLISFYGTSDVPTLISSEFDAHPWEDHELLWKHSPLAYAQHIKTPLLIIHAENDFRVPIEQGEQLFAFVRRSGGTVEMVRYPRDGHEMSRSGEPEHRVSRLTRMVDWFDRYCMPQE